MTACSESGGAEAKTKRRFAAQVAIEPTASGDETVQNCDATNALLLRLSRINASESAALRRRGNSQQAPGWPLRPRL